MFRRTVVALSQNSKRTVVRDPRKKRVPVVRQDETAASEIEPVHTTTQSSRQPLPFEPNSQNQQAVGGLGSYMLAGAGMAVGFSIVGAIFGGF